MARKALKKDGKPDADLTAGRELNRLVGCVRVVVTKEATLARESKCPFLSKSFPPEP